MAKRYVRGDRAFKRLIDQLPGTVRAEVLGQLRKTGESVLAEARNRVPAKTGALRSALSLKVYDKTLKMKVGLLTKAVNRRFYYGLFVEYGVKASGRGVTRTGKGAAKYRLGIGKQDARHFIYTRKRENLNAPFRDIWDRALKRASQGISDA